MNKLLTAIAMDLAIYFGAALALLGIIGAFVGARSLTIVFSIAVAGLLMMKFGLRARKISSLANSGVAPFSLDKRAILNLRMTESFG